MFAKLEAKLIGALVVVLIIAGLYWRFHSLENENTELTKENAVATHVVAQQDQTIKNDAKAGQINNDVGVKTQQEVKTVVQVQREVVEKVKKKERIIQEKFDLLPSTAENEVQKMNELSEVRIKGWWESYCKGIPNAPQC